MQKEYPSAPDNFSNTQAHRDAIRSYLFSHDNPAFNLHPFRSLQVNAYDGAEYPSDPYLVDSRIQPRIVEINFIQDNTGWNNDNEECGSYNYERYKGQGDKTDAALMVYLVEGIYVGSPPALWTVGGCGKENYIILHGFYKSYVENGPEISPPNASNFYFLRELAAHELGHSLGSLSHPFSGDSPNCSTTTGCDFDDMAPCPTWCGGCYPYTYDANTPNCSNNIMSYATVRRYLSPKQIGSIHRNLTRSAQARFVSHALDSPAADLHLTTSETWSVDRFVHGDVYIEPGATLTVNCVVYMPPRSRIIVKQGARLIVDCGKLTTNRMPLNSLQQFQGGDYWTGIEVWGNTLVPQTPAMRSPAYVQQLTDPGIVLLTDAEISHARPGIMTVQRGAYSWDIKKTNFGGLIYANRTVFDNNFVSARFLKYDFRNLSAFIDCTFQNIPPGSDVVTMWETDGIEFKRCTIYQTTSKGILAFDAEIKVTGCMFIDNHHAVENYTSYPMSSRLMVGPTELGEGRNIFQDCGVGVFISSTAIGDVIKNDFNNCLEGVYATGDCQYTIAGNNFKRCIVGVHNYNTLEAARSFVSCNTFDRNDIGCQFSGDNSSIVLLYNDFLFKAAGRSDNIRIGPATDLWNVYPGSIRYFQRNENGANGDLSAGNLFGAQPGPLRRHIVAPPSSTSLFEYHHSDYDFNERVYPVCGINPVIPCVPNYPVDQNFTYQDYPDKSHDPSYCAQFSTIESICDTDSCFSFIDSLYQQALVLYGADTSSLNKSNLAKWRSARWDALRRNMLRLQREGNYLAYSSLLTGEDHDFGRRARLWSFIDQEDWAGASSYLDAFPVLNDNDLAFVEVQRINIRRLRLGYDYTLTAGSVDTLEAIANAILPDRIYARALLVQLNGDTFEPEELEGIEPRSPSIPATPAHAPVIWPNPANEWLSVYLDDLVRPGDRAMISVVSISGRVVLRETLSARREDFDISGLPAGFYIVDIRVGGSPVVCEKLSIVR